MEHGAWGIERGVREMEKEISNNEQGILNYEGGRERLNCRDEALPCLIQTEKISEIHAM